MRKNVGVGFGFCFFVLLPFVFVLISFVLFCNSFQKEDSSVSHNSCLLLSKGSVSSRLLENKGPREEIMKFL